MRILHLDSGKEMRGGQWQVLRLIEALAANAVESTLLAREGSPLFERARKYGWRVEPFGVARALALAPAHDLIHAHDARGHTIGLMRSGRLIVSRRVAFEPGSRWKYRQASRYIAVSEFVKAVLVKAGVLPEKITVVYDGVPLLSETGRGSNVLAISKSGTMADEVARLAGVSLKVGADLERDLGDATLFLYITEAEGLGSAVLLAMSAGVPVVASRIGGLPEIVRHGETGLLVENKPEAIASAIRRLLDDRDLARRMGAAGRRAVIECFTVDHMVRRTMEIYRQVLS